MLGLFKKKTERQILEKKYRELLEQAHKLSNSDRKASDLKTQEANEIAIKLDQLPPA